MTNAHKKELQPASFTIDDISTALAKGVRDFQAAPLYGLFFGAIYAACGLALLVLAWEMGYEFMAYPMMAGFALIGPFIAVGVYQVSRLKEKKQPITWKAVLGSVITEGGKEIGWMALVNVFGFIIWIYSAGFLYALFFGLTPLKIDDLIDTVISSPRGLAFILFGNIIGAMIALIMFSISVISYPMLLDREVDFVTAMITSVKVVLTNPATMCGWAIMIVVLLTIGTLPFFLGLCVVLPIIGHTSWHIYRAAVPSSSS